MNKTKILTFGKLTCFVFARHHFLGYTGSWYWKLTQKNEMDRYVLVMSNSLSLSLLNKMLWISLKDASRKQLSMARNLAETSYVTTERNERLKTLLSLSPLCKARAFQWARGIQAFQHDNRSTLIFPKSL